MLKSLKTINKKIVPGTYKCDKCGSNGNINNMILIINKGLFHTTCLKKVTNLKK